MLFWALNEFKKTSIMKKLLFLFFVTSFGYQQLSAQNFEIPSNYKFEKAEDFTTYEPQVKECINWLLETPLNTNENKRLHANKFFVEYVISSPFVTIELNSKITPFTKKNPDLLVAFMAAWAKNTLDNKSLKDDVVAGSLAGLRGTIAFYQMNLAAKSIKKVKDLDRIIAIDKKGKLEEWVKSKLNEKP